MGAQALEYGMLKLPSVQLVLAITFVWNLELELGIKRWEEFWLTRED